MGPSASAIAKSPEIAAHSARIAGSVAILAIASSKARAFCWAANSCEPRSSLTRRLELGKCSLRLPWRPRPMVRDHSQRIRRLSPAPMYEWPHLVKIFGVNQLARLLAVSPSSVRRYKENARTTPDDIAGRLHFLALVVGDLAGAYNDIGIRRWFERARTSLGNRAPQEFFRGEWSPNDAGATRVRELACSPVAAAT